MSEQDPLLRLDILEIPLERDGFITRLLRELSGCLQDVVGMDDAAGFVSVVGQRVGETINAHYRTALKQSRLTRRQVAAAMVDLKRRLDGDFYIIEQDETKIVLGNRRCPFGDKVRDRPALCMMTSNVFGVLAAENLGYARIDLQQTIARGAPGCRVVIHLQPDADGAHGPGRTYVRSAAQDGQETTA